MIDVPDARGEAGLVTIVEAQRRTGIPGPQLMRAVVYGDIPSTEGDHGIEMVDLADVEAWAARRADT